MRAWCNGLFPGDPNLNQNGNYAEFTPPDNLQPSYYNYPNQFNPAPYDNQRRWGWRDSGFEELSRTVIDENSYNLDGIAWQIIP
jgi:hypothetical protein